MGVKILEVRNLSKSFSGRNVLDSLSFDVKKGEIFGLLGPNGAGKTTIIRIILDIIRADYGEINLFGKEFLTKNPERNFKSKIGYLPEERGLYQKTTVLECLKYFAQLKNVRRPEVQVDFWLDSVGLFNCKNKRIGELSKGMQQKIQLIASFIHNPELMIFDEPFSGLDPINTKEVKDIMFDFANAGKTIILSTHQMDQVERMCDRIMMIDQGKRVLYGSIDEIKSGYEEPLVIEYEGVLEPIEGVKRINYFEKHAELVLEGGTDPDEVLKKLIENVKIKRFERKAPSLNEIFIGVVENAKV